MAYKLDFTFVAEVKDLFYLCCQINFKLNFILLNVISYYNYISLETGCTVIYNYLDVHAAKLETNEHF